ncbi:MAG: vitamin K epoxide reductase family protein [bacterium]|nr:vitamin K epoxide reductase family protein [bacterium]
MDKKVILTPFYLIAATLVGLGDTLFLSYYAYLDIIPGCAIGGCEIVLASAYSHPFGVPFGYIGLVYYGYMLALAILLAIEPDSKALRFATLAYTGIGLLLSIGFELFQFFVIGALCLYCGISALTTLVLFILAVWHWKKS